MKLFKERRKLLILLIRWSAGIACALFTPLVLRWLGLATLIDAQFIALGFDSERVLLLEYLVLTLLGSAISALVFQCRGAAWAGGILYFVLRYLLPFSQQAQHPAPGPDGQAQVLLSSAFTDVLLTLFALAVLLAGAGTVIGFSYGRLLIVPLMHLGQRIVQKDTGVPRPTLFVSFSTLIAGLLLVETLIFGMTGAGPLLTYGPTINLYHSVSRPGSMAVPHGTVMQRTFLSPILGNIQRTYWIYLPPSYAPSPQQHYPVLYLLHGSPGGPVDWFQAAHVATTTDALLAERKIRETILIGVDGNGPIYRFSEWANSFDGRQRMEDALVKDLVPFIDAHYRTLAHASDRAIGGLSMGGYGAVNIALHHPDVFHGVMSVGGYFQAEGPIFGSGVGSDVYRQLNSPSFFVQTPAGKHALAQLTMVIGISTGDGRYYKEGLAWYRQTLAIKASVRLLTAVGGHSWLVWAKQFGDVLPLLEPPVS